MDNKIDKLILQAEKHISRHKECCKKIKELLSPMICKEIDFEIFRQFINGYSIVFDTLKYNYINIPIDRILEKHNEFKKPLTEEELYKLSIKVK